MVSLKGDMEVGYDGEVRRDRELCQLGSLVPPVTGSVTSDSLFNL